MGSGPTLQYLPTPFQSEMGMLYICPRLALPSFTLSYAGFFTFLVICFRFAYPACFPGVIACISHTTSLPSLHILNILTNIFAGLEVPAFFTYSIGWFCNITYSGQLCWLQLEVLLISIMWFRGVFRSEASSSSLISTNGITGGFYKVFRHVNYGP